jgi:hypothetical protein
MPTSAPPQRQARPARRHASAPLGAVPRARSPGWDARRRLLPEPPGEASSWPCPQAPPPGAGSRGWTRLYLVGMCGERGRGGTPRRQQAGHRGAAARAPSARRPARPYRFDVDPHALAVERSAAAGDLGRGFRRSPGSTRKRASRGWHVRDERHYEEVAKIARRVPGSAEELVFTSTGNTVAGIGLRTKDLPYQLRTELGTYVEAAPRQAGGGSEEGLCEPLAPVAGWVLGEFGNALNGKEK